MQPSSLLASLLSIRLAFLFFILAVILLVPYNHGIVVLNLLPFIQHYLFLLRLDLDLDIDLYLGLA